jgi:hypothetical protein
MIKLLCLAGFAALSLGCADALAFDSSPSPWEGGGAFGQGAGGDQSHFSSRRNPTGGFDYSNGVTSRPNPLGGYDYSNGASCRPNPMGGMDCRR